MRKLNLSCALVLIPLLSFCQKEVRTYYDAQKNHIQEIYFLSPEDNESFVGLYQRFYENGNMMLTGNFDNGKKAGVFTEFHNAGKPARKTTYVNGLRHGTVEVFNEEGLPVQKAYYQND